MTNRFLIIMLCIVLLGAGCFRWSERKDNEPSAEDVQGIPFQQIEDFVPADEEPSAPPEDLEVPPEHPEPKPGEVASYSGNVVVSSIVENQKLSNPFVIYGRARAFEGTVNWRIRDQRYDTLAEGIVLTNAPDVGRFGSFRVRAFFDEVPTVERGFVEVFTISPRNGAEQDFVSIPVRLPTDVTPIKVYFSNIKEDPESEFCERVYPVTRRVVKTQNIAEAAILELLKGPTVAEQTGGSRTSIYPGTILRSVSITDGVASVDFSKDFTYAIAGSCHVQAITAQVHETLKQFDSVKVVKILVEGEDAEIELQP